MRIFIVAGILVLAGSFASSQDGAARPASDPALCSDRRTIESYCRSLDRQVKALPQRTFGTPFSEESGWREIRGDYEGDTARVSTRDGRPFVVAFVFSSQSGDWVQYVTYYYRSDGTLAKKHDLLNTFYGNVSVTKDAFYTCSGSVLWKHVRILDLETKQPKPPDTDFFDEPSPEYKRVEQLPFVHLLPKSGSSGR